MKIMFVMLRTLGDVMLGHTICRELKRDYPQSEIHFYTNSSYAPLLWNSPYVDRLHESVEWTFDSLFIEMARTDYDFIYAPYQVRASCNMWHQDEATRHQHLVDFYWQRMGIHRLIEERECYLFPQAKDFEIAEKMMTFDVPRIAIHSTSGVATKDWPYFEQLTEELRKAGFAALQVGARSDRIVPGAINFRGKMSLTVLAAFLSNCAAFVGLDSGLSYMADAMKIPTIVIQGSTSPVTSGPISNRVIHLFSEKTGYPDCEEIRCHINCRHEINCNTKITVEMVAEKLNQILEKLGPVVPVGV